MAHPFDASSPLGGHEPADLLGLALARDPASAARHWSPPSTKALSLLFPGYAIERLLGRGGMGAVYLARDLALDRPVAIKLLPAELGRDEAFSHRFRREASAMAGLRHPHIVPVLHSGQTKAKHLYYVMPHLEGGSLQERIHPPSTEYPRLAPRRALEIIEQVCDALAYAHGQGIVHRDIKPDNVLLERDGRAQVGDFGVARLASGEAERGVTTLTGEVFGTPEYMAPEQRRGEHVDHRADLYSAGVMLYEALCGEAPGCPWEPISQRTGLDPELDDIATRALWPDPADRFQSAAEMKSAIARCRSALKDAPPQSAQSPAPVFTPDHSAKRGRIRGAAFLAAGAALAALAFFGWQHNKLAPPGSQPPKIATPQPATPSGKNS